MPFNRLIFRVHAIQRMFQRRISKENIIHVLTTGEVIEKYPENTPYPSCLFLGWCKSRPLHVVAADNNESKETIIITVYEPNIDEWEPDFKKRRKQ